MGRRHENPQSLQDNRTPSYPCFAKVSLDRIKDDGMENHYSLTPQLRLQKMGQGP